MLEEANIHQELLKGLELQDERIRFRWQLKIKVTVMSCLSQSSEYNISGKTYKEFQYMWHKRPCRLEDELMRIWWSKVKVTVTSQNMLLAIMQKQKGSRNNFYSVQS